MPAVAIVGYTNVGKSTLLNALTGSEVVVRDKLFATLDPTVRRFRAEDGKEILFIDTVGFLNELPHHLIEAFKATLEEVTEADCILHVVDISHPKAKEQSDAVFRVLEEIGAGKKTIVTALNKIDKVTGGAAADTLKGHFPDAVTISALQKTGFPELMEKVVSALTPSKNSIENS